MGFHEVATVTGVNRGFGLFGDMVISLSGGDKLELRSVPECASLFDLFFYFYFPGFKDCL